MATPKRFIGKVRKIAGVTISPSVVEVSHGGSNVTIETTDRWLLCVLGIALARGDEIAITYDEGPPRTLRNATLTT